MAADLPTFLLSVGAVLLIRSPDLFNLAAACAYTVLAATSRLCVAAAWPAGRPCFPPSLGFAEVISINQMSLPAGRTAPIFPFLWRPRPLHACVLALLTSGFAGEQKTEIFPAFDVRTQRETENMCDDAFA